MGTVHENVVDDLYHNLLQNEIYDDTSQWDAILKEDEYYAVDEDEFHYDQPIGEFDVLLIDWETQRMHYYEVKTQNSSKAKGRRQIRRAKQHFSDLGYNLTGEVYTP